jgi:hypothetical protein
MKQMAHHLLDLNLSFLSDTINVLLIRDPVEMLPSLVNQLPDPTLADTGLLRQIELFEELSKRDQTPVILDARETLLNPTSVLETLCARIGISFSKTMLTWEPNPRPEDGIWARHWYHNVHKSSGFSPYRPKTEPFPERLLPLLEECVPYYQSLYASSIKANKTL